MAFLELLVIFKKFLRKTWGYWVIFRNFNFEEILTLYLEFVEWNYKKWNCFKIARDESLNENTEWSNQISGKNSHVNYHDIFKVSCAV